MRLLFVPSAAVVTLLLTWATAGAQTQFNRRSYPNVNDAYQSGLKTYYKTWADLNRAQYRVAANPGDWYRASTAQGQMDLLERTWQDGSFDRAQLNQAISDVQFVLRFNSISTRDREALAQDLEQLRDIRARYGG
jgi:hypothetical protein